MLYLNFVLFFLCFQVPQDYESQKEFSDQLNYVNGIIGMLDNPDVVKELDIVDFQKSELEAIGKAVQFRMINLSMNSSIRGVAEDERMKKYMRLKGFLETQVKRIKEDVLVPEQFAKLERAYFRQKVFHGHHFRYSGLVELVPDLNVSKEQEKKMGEITKNAREEIKKLTEEFNKKVKAVQLESKRKILRTLDADQRKLVKEKFGTIVPDEKNKKD